MTLKDITPNKSSEGEFTDKNENSIKWSSSNSHNFSNITATGLNSAALTGKSNNTISYDFSDGNGGGAWGLTLQVGGISGSEEVGLKVNGAEINLLEFIEQGHAVLVDSSQYPENLRENYLTGADDATVTSDGTIISASGGTSAEDLVFVYFKIEVFSIEVTSIKGNIAADIYSGAPCFMRGTSIQTRDGLRNVESIKEGDIVKIASGFSKVLWVGRRLICFGELQANPKLLPVRIVAGMLGGNMPQRDLVVSCQHRMLVSSKITERMLGEPEALISAIKLAELPGIFVDVEVKEAEYFHLLLDRHEIIFAEGAPTESLYAGPEALRAFSRDMREEIYTILPDLANLDSVPVPARIIPSGKFQKKLIERHKRNKRPVLEGWPEARECPVVC